MVSLIATAAKAEHVGVFHRFELMRRWREAEQLPFETFVSTDGLHMNDWSYACLAKALGRSDRRGRDASDRDRGRAAPRAGQLIGPGTASNDGRRQSPCRRSLPIRRSSHRLQRREQVLDEIVGMLQAA